MNFSRDRELDLLLTTLQNNGGSAAVVGDTGSGRTTIAETAAARTEEPVAMVRSSSAESGWQYSGVSVVLAALDSALGTELRLQVESDGLSGDPYDVARTIEERLRATVNEPCLLVIDDVDVLDSASQRVLGYVIRRRPSPVLKTLLTMHSTPHGGPFSGIPQIALGSLDVPALVEFGRSLTSRTSDYAVLELIARISSGNPMACRSILGELSEEQIAGEAPLPMPLRPGSALTAATLPRLEPLSTQGRALLGLVASAPYLREDACPEAVNATTEAVEELVAGRVLERAGGMLRAKDVVLGAVAYWALESAERISIHRGFAAECEGRYPGLSAWHQSFFSAPGDFPDMMLDEAIALARAGKVGMSVAFTERALGISGGHVRADLLIDLAKELTQISEYDAARRLIQFANRPDGPDDVKPAIARELIVLDYIQFQIVTQGQGSPLASLHARDHPANCPLIFAAAMMGCLDRWELREARDLVQQAESMIGGVSPVTEAMHVLVSWFARSFSGEAMPGIVELQAEAEPVREVFGMETATIMLARALSLGERFVDARELITGLLDFGQSIARIWVDFALQVHLDNETRAGRFHRVKEIFDIVLARRGSHRSFLVNRGLTQAALDCAAGEPAEATATIRDLLRSVVHRQGPAHEGMIAMRQGKIAMSEHRFDAAVEHFGRARRFSLQLENPQLLRVYGDYVESLLYLGRREEAQAMVDELRALSSRTPSHWASVLLGVLDAQLLDDEDAVAAFAKLFEEWDDGEYKYLRARAAFSYAERLDRAGYRRRAIDARAEAMNRFRELGVQVESGGSGDVADAPKPTSVFDLLDDKETAVVQLLAQGLKNRAIASELFVSVRTVELRLTSVYRKVGVKSRFELMRLVAER